MGDAEKVEFALLWTGMWATLIGGGYVLYRIWSSDKARNGVLAPVGRFLKCVLPWAFSLGALAYGLWALAKGLR